MGGPDELLLVHRDAADDLLEIFAEENAGDETLDLGETIALRQSAGPGGEALQRLTIGGEPGQTMEHVLLALEARLIEAARIGEAAHDAAAGLGEKSGDRLGGSVETVRGHQVTPCSP